MPNLTGIRAVGVALMHGDGQTNMMTLIGTFCEYVNARKMVQIWPT